MELIINIAMEAVSCLELIDQNEEIIFGKDVMPDTIYCIVHFKPIQLEILKWISFHVVKIFILT